MAIRKSESTTGRTLTIGDPRKTQSPLAGTASRATLSTQNSTVNNDTIKHHTTSNNFFPMCADLTLSAGQGSDENSIILLSDLRFGKQRIDLNGYTVSVEAVQAKLSIRIDGGTVRRDSRLGDFLRPSSESFEKTTETLTKQQALAEFSTNGKVSDKGAHLGSALNLGLTHAHSKVKKSKHSQLVHTNRVCARGGNTWEIKENNAGTPLDGTYIRDEPLCIIDWNSENKKIQCSINIARRHLFISEVTDTLSGRSYPINFIKQKILNIIATKAISFAGEDVKFCEAELVSEGTK